MIRQVVLGATVLTTCSGQTTPAKALPNPTIFIYVYSAGSATERDIHDMEQATNSIFSRAGIDVSWLTYSKLRPEYSTFAPSSDSGPASIELRIVDRLDRGGVHVLAWAVPNLQSITMQYKGAQQIARASTIGLSVGDILGHVAAHEIGHVLLGSGSHGAFGVLKSTYEQRDFLSMVQGRLVFSPEEARMLLDKVRTRSEQYARTLSK